MRAKLIELTPERSTRLGELGVRNIAFSIAWQSSKVPFTARQATLSVAGRGHEAALHLGDAALREEHHQPHVGAAAERLHRRAAGVARGGADDGEPPPLGASAWS